MVKIRHDKHLKKVVVDVLVPKDWIEELPAPYSMRLAIILEALEWVLLIKVFPTIVIVDTRYVLVFCDTDKNKLDITHGGDSTKVVRFGAYPQPVQCLCDQFFIAPELTKYRDNLESIGG